MSSSYCSIRYIYRTKEIARHGYVRIVLDDHNTAQHWLRRMRYSLKRPLFYKLSKVIHKVSVTLLKFKSQKVGDLLKKILLFLYRCALWKVYRNRIHKCCLIYILATCLKRCIRIQFIKRYSISSRRRTKCNDYTHEARWWNKMK